jgi:disulfide oxidoreductase YuzD
MTSIFMVTVELPDTVLSETEALETIGDMYKAIEDALAMAFPRHPFKVTYVDTPEHAANVFRYRQRQGASF